MTRPLAIAILLLLALVMPVGAREVIIDVKGAEGFIVVEEQDGERILRMSEFEASTDEFILSGTSGRYVEAEERMEAFGAPAQPASLSRTGEDPFSVTAFERIILVVRDESLRAEGGVRYTSGEVEASGRSLWVDRREVVLVRVEELLAKVASAASRAAVLDFFAGAGDDDRIVLLEGEVRVVRNDSDMTAGWIVFNEARPDEFVSVADPNLGLQLRVVIDAEDEDAR